MFMGFQMIIFCYSYMIMVETKDRTSKDILDEYNSLLGGSKNEVNA